MDPSVQSRRWTLRTNISECAFMAAEDLSIWPEGVDVRNMEGVVIPGGDPPAVLSPVGFWNPRICRWTSKKCRVKIKTGMDLKLR